MRAAAAIVLALATAARADGGDPLGDPITKAAPADEAALLGELAKDHLIKARTDAEAILADRPDSFVATWAMARVEHDEEGSFPRALFLVHRAQGLLAVQHPGIDSWERKLALEEYWIDSGMDRNADAIAVLDRLERDHGAVDPSLRIWPLFKLGRRDESRAIAKQLALSDNELDRLHAYNGILALEFETHDRLVAYEWATKAVDAVPEFGLVLANASGVAFMRFKLREAEELALRAHEAREQDTYGGGYDQLAGLYLVEGEIQKAIAALKSLAARPLEKRDRPFEGLRRRGLLADVLLVLGKVDDGYRLAGEVYAQPERLGMISSDPRIAAFVRALRYRLALDAKVESEAEQAAARSSSISWDRVQLGIERWSVGRQLVQLSASGDVLVTMTRPNLGEEFQVAAFRTMSLVDVLGIGVMRDAVAASRSADASVPEAAAYLDLFDAELAYRAGDLSRALDGARAALPKLQPEEAVLRWRTLAWQADALRRLGKSGEAAPLYHEVLQKLPSILRLLHLAVPVSITGDGSALAAEAARRLRGSPRFDAASSAPFKISATSKAGTVELCLTDDAGYQFACAHGDARPDDGDAAVTSAIDAFHAAAFSPKVNLDQQDLNSLDGSPVRASADEVLKGVLEP